MGDEWGYGINAMLASGNGYQWLVLFATIPSQFNHLNKKNETNMTANDRTNNKLPGYRSLFIPYCPRLNTCQQP
ncbi:MAG: hypothetical protein WKF89_20685 [Chitinophagaceae bacterium]